MPLCLDCFAFLAPRKHQTSPEEEPLAPRQQDLAVPPRVQLAHALPKKQGWEALLQEEDVQWLHIGDGWLPPLVEVPLKLRVGEKEFRRLVKPPSVEALWEWYEEHGKTSADPSWAQVWPCAAALALLLTRQPGYTVRGKRVVELGAGLGVAGLAAALAGADVLLLDREPLALHCAASTAALQSLPVGAVDAPHAEHMVRAAVYDWSASQTFNFPADVVVASEVLYDPSEALQVSVSAMKLMGEAQPCVAFVSNTDDLAHNNSQLSLNISLEAPQLRNCRLLITDPRRERCPGTREALATGLRQAGATVELYEAPTPCLGDGLQDQEDVAVIDAIWK
ncbi:unnamed protein product [Durusdinium trenchii]|uniref:Uncharacterized protein n=1 Tax=Durusdinium trenchii TaxID=1381693 RepID=A0ABP0LQK2_9DINO